QHPVFQHPPVTIDLGWKFHCNIYTVPPVIPSAPWYTYFPYDPHLMSPTAASHYPNWPQPFPPNVPPGPASPVQAPGSSPIAPRPAPGAPQIGSLQIGSPQLANPQSLQPVGYMNFQPPSYWYAR